MILHVHAQGHIKSMVYYTIMNFFVHALLGYVIYFLGGFVLVLFLLPAVLLTGINRELGLLLVLMWSFLSFFIAYKLPFARPIWKDGKDRSLSSSLLVGAPASIFWLYSYYLIITGLV